MNAVVRDDPQIEFWWSVAGNAMVVLVVLLLVYLWLERK